MNTSIEQSLIEQNPHWQGQAYQHAFTRLHDKAVLDDLSLDEVQLITGIRRCGKSTLLQIVINHLMQQHSAKSILYINFDDPSYTPIYNEPSQLHQLLTTTEKLTGEVIDYLFLDEVQNVDAWEQYVKSVYDSKKFKKIFVTGSNADLLDSDYATLLSGRYIETRLYPLSYQELLINNGISSNLLLVQQKAKVLRLLDSMLQYGGFPRIYCVDEDKRSKILKSYYETILLKDCIKNNNIRDTRTLMALAHYLISNVSTVYSYNSLSKALASNENTIQQFIHVLQSAYFIHEVKQFSYSLKTQNRAAKKTYCIDNGLVSATTFKFVDNTSQLLENLVYTELCKRHEGQVYFFNDTKECDFIVHHEHHPLAIQVCHSLHAGSHDREFAGLKAGMDKFSIPQGIVITYDQEYAVDQSIQVVPFWKYFFK